jgi:hypothetical protein
MQLLLGHNQFIGISHISEEKSMELNERFDDPRAIYRVVETAVELGYKNMVIENHPKIIDFIRLYKDNDNLDMNFYIQVPNIQNYIRQMNNGGISGLFKEISNIESIKGLSSFAISGALHLAKKDYFGCMASALALELSPFSGLNIKAILLHNVSTDLLLCLKLSEAFKEYIEYINKSLKMRPGFITLNFPLLKANFESWDIEPQLVMTPINLKGYDMNPSKEKVESAIKSYSGEIIAMNVLGGGAFPVREASLYIRSLKNIDFCVVGASSREHLQDLIHHFE